MLSQILIRRNFSDSDVDTLNKNDEILKLKKNLLDLQSELTLTRTMAKSNEEMLQILLKKEVKKSLKLRKNLEITKSELSIAESELGHLQRNQQSADASIKRVRLSAQDLSKNAVTDREWLEKEVARRSVITKATRRKSELELARIRRRLSST